jgi:FKBP-type peptidyl-prolyl cis-trans isomerase FkpA/FKBP-type peptidyl-prolyl cis-trans isomerase FklB
MKKLFYFFAIASATMSMACNNETKKTTNEEEAATEATKDVPTVVLEECTCGECEQCLLQQSIEEQIAAYEALMAEIGEQPLSEVMNKRSYSMGANMGLQFNSMNELLELDLDLVMASMLEFFIAGDYEDEAFLATMNEMQMFFYNNVNNYSRAKQQRDAFEAAGMTENLPELPELYNDVMTRERAATIIGHSFGASLKDVDNFDFAWFTKGFTDAYAIEDLSTIESVNAGLALTTEEMTTELASLQQEMMVKAQAKYEQMCEENKATSEAWLAEVEKEEGVQKTESGILYRIDREGDGAYPTQDSAVVEVHYEGTLSDGTVFDSSYERGETISFALNQVIKGWTEGMKLINEGGQITLWIPAELAYGTADRGTIKPNSALKFKVELFKVTETTETVEPNVAE